MEKKVLKFSAKFEDIGSHGQFTTPFTMEDFKSIGCEYADTVKVSFLGRYVIVPLVPSYRCTHSGGPLIMVSERFPKASLLSYHANFMKQNHIAVFLENEDRTIDIMVNKDVKFPIDITFELYEKGGYKEGFETYNLKRSHERKDYPHLTDEEYANFRNVIGGKIKPGILYRSSTPISPELDRNTYADAAVKKYGIKTIINLNDDEKSAKSYPGYNDTYYSKQNVLFLNSNADITSYNFGKSVLKAMRFMISHEGPYLVHCVEGQDRTGAVCAIWESLMRATKYEMIEDFMKTYENYYGVRKGSKQYETIIKGEMQENIASIRGFSYSTLDVLKFPEDFLEFLDLTHDEIEQFKRVLSGVDK